MDYEDTNAEEWKKYFKLEEDLARRNPKQFEAYKANIHKAYESKRNDSEEEEGDGWLKINWRE